MSDREFPIVVNTEELWQTKINELSKIIFEGEDFILVPNSYTMLDILFKCGIFQSKGQARKNWKKTGTEIPNGFTDLEGIGKLNKRITIWKPI